MLHAYLIIELRHGRPCRTLASFVALLVQYSYRDSLATTPFVFESYFRLRELKVVKEAPKHDDSLML